jgi:hypothetical protein
MVLLSVDQAGRSIEPSGTQRLNFSTRGVPHQAILLRVAGATEQRLEDGE